MILIFKLILTLFQVLFKGKLDLAIELMAKDQQLDLYSKKFKAEK